MHRTVALASLLLLVPVVSSAQARDTEITLDGVTVRGEPNYSSSGVPRSPRFVVTNTSTHRRTIELVELASIEGSERRVLALHAPHTLTLAPGASRTLSLAYDGDPLPSPYALTSHTFALTVRVGAASAEAIASVGYICQIAPRH